MAASPRLSFPCIGPAQGIHFGMSVMPMKTRSLKTLSCELSEPLPGGQGVDTIASGFTVFEAA